MSRITINSNVLSLNTQRYLTKHTSDLRTSFTRLSSGLRINKASDDAAGLSVSSLLNADRRVASQGVRNINDGISYLSVAEGALNELSNIVTRIQELAEQGANGTLGTSQRESLQSEVTSLEAEYNRIIATTEFNGNQLLTGNTTKTVLQGGYGINGQLSVQVGDSVIEGAIDNLAGYSKRVSESASGSQANADSGSNDTINISADGRYIVFSSNASNLVASDTNGATDIFVKDSLTGAVTLVSASAAGVIGNGTSTRASITADGRYVTFTSTSSNLVSGDTNGVSDIFVKDLQTGEIVRASTDSAGGEVSGAALISSISADGRFVTFESSGAGLVAGDTNGVADIFLKDLQTGLTTRVSTNSTGVQANAQSRVGAISADGRYVSFYSDATNLVDGDTNGVTDIFVKDLQTGITERVSTDSSGVQGNAISSNYSSATISADGRFVTFSSSANNLVANDSNALSDIFVKDRLTGATTRVNTASDGTQSNNLTGGGIGISADGRFIVFGSLGSNLVDGDTNATYDTFVKDMFTGNTRRVNTDNLGSEANGFTGNAAISADGLSVIFASDATNIIANDTNGVRDIFLKDLSVGGIQEIAGLVVSNQASARVSIDLAKKYQEKLSSYKAGIGTSLSRANSFVSTLQSLSDNYLLAASQITDVDVAEEAANLTKTQILQQAASSILAQANAQPEIALRLLQD